MHTLFLRCICVFSTLLFFAGCGASSIITISGANDGTPNTSPGTRTSGPVSFTTNHAEYALVDGIAVTVTNQLHNTIYAFNHQASCSILNLQQQQGSQWVDVSQAASHIAGCAQASASALVAVQAGETYQAVIVATYLHKGDQQFAPGTYRLALAYTITPTTLTANSFVTVYSAVITINSNLAPAPTSAAPVVPGAGSPQVAPSTTPNP